MSFEGDSLNESITVTGNITAHLFASTSASDADFVVKLIDVYPDFNRKSILMSGYELPVAMEVFRGRFRKSFVKPEPLTPNEPSEFVIDLHQVNHTFLKGHRIMVQVQNSFFPMADRNPQRFTNIYTCDSTAFQKANIKIYHSNQYPSGIKFNMLRDE